MTPSFGMEVEAARYVIIECLTEGHCSLELVGDSLPISRGHTVNCEDALHEENTHMLAGLAHF